MVRKRDGKLVRYDESKIRVAITKAFQELGQKPDIEVITSICEEISSIADKSDISVEEIQDMVEDMLMASAHKDVARAYVRYRYKREEARALQANLEARNKKIRQLICVKTKKVRLKILTKILASFPQCEIILRVLLVGN